MGHFRRYVAGPRPHQLGGGAIDGQRMFPALTSLGEPNVEINRGRVVGVWPRGVLEVEMFAVTEAYASHRNTEPRPPWDGFVALAAASNRARGDGF